MSLAAPIACDDPRMPEPPDLIDDGDRRICWWCGDDAGYRSYHDREWGRPVADDVRLFEKLCLEGFQAGLSWLTILRKRDHFRRAFADFEPAVVATFDDADVERLVADAGIVRHRGKITSTINNAGRALELQDDAGSIAAFVWGFAPPAGPAPRSRAELPATSPESTALSKALKQRGWTFVGPTTAYAFMQAVGIVNDHLAGCAVRDEVEAARASFEVPR